MTVSYAGKMIDSVLQRHPVLAEHWNYEFGLILKAIGDVWEINNNKSYFNYIKENMDRFVQPDGSIHTYRIDEYNLDQVNAGKVLLLLFRATNDDRYRKAAALLRQQLANHPRTKEGGFWHKKIYPWQMWLDGLYMAGPFYAEYGKMFNEPVAFDDVANQLILTYRHTKDPNTGLLYHGWDESKTQAWADKTTGCSANFWGRAMGWYAMTLVDVLEYLPENHTARPAVVAILQDVAVGLAKYQDQATGLWYQVLDQGTRTGNYLEASGSSMVVYALAKSVRKGYLEPRYADLAQKGYRGLIERFIVQETDGTISLTGICKVAGLGRYHPDRPYRDGSFEYYINEPVVANDYKGVGPFTLACTEIELQK